MATSACNKFNQVASCEMTSGPVCGLAVSATAATLMAAAPKETTQVERLAAVEIGVRVLRVGDGAR